MVVAAPLTCCWVQLKNHKLDYDQLKCYCVAVEELRPASSIAELAPIIGHQHQQLAGQGKRLTLLLLLLRM